MNTVTLKPAVVEGEQLKVRKPQGGYLAPEGEPIVLTTYWRRRLAAGDVIEVTKADAAKPDQVKAGQVKTDKPAA